VGRWKREHLVENPERGQFDAFAGARARNASVERSVVTSLLRLSAEDLADDAAMNVCEAAVAAVVAEGEALVVNSQQVQDRGMEIVAIGRLE
jgi:hypothetical protein